MIMIFNFLEFTSYPHNLEDFLTTIFPWQYISAKHEIKCPSNTIILNETICLCQPPLSTPTVLCFRSYRVSQITKKHLIESTNTLYLKPIFIFYRKSTKMCCVPIFKVRWKIEKKPKQMKNLKKKKSLLNYITHPGFKVLTKAQLLVLYFRNHIC